MVAIDRWVCHECGWVYEGACRPHEPLGDTVDEVGNHQWQVHRSVNATEKDGLWTHREEG